MFDIIAYVFSDLYVSIAVCSLILGAVWAYIFESNEAELIKSGQHPYIDVDGELIRDARLDDKVFNHTLVDNTDLKTLLSQATCKTPHAVEVQDAVQEPNTNKVVIPISFQ